MNTISNLDNAIILSDFDGTITTFDTNVKLFNKFGEGKYINKIKTQYLNGEIELRTLFDLEFQSIKLTEEMYLKFMLEDIKLQEGFERFYKNLEKHNIPFIIISGGLINGINPFMEEHGFKNIPTYANKLKFNGDKAIVEYYEDEYLKNSIKKDSYIDFKVEILNNYREKYEKIIFLGDGITDMNVADQADFLFAKDHLEEHCINNNIEHIKWSNFHDVNDLMFPKTK